MTKFQLNRPDGPWDYPTFGFRAAAGAILDGTLFDPEITDVDQLNDTFWDVYVGGSAQTGITIINTNGLATPGASPTDGSIPIYRRSLGTHENMTPAEWFADPEISAPLSAAYAAYFMPQKYGAIADGVADDTAAIQEAIDQATAALSLVKGQIAIWFADGTYNSERFAVPGRISLLGQSAKGSIIRNLSTDGGVFIHMRGSFSAFDNITADGQRVEQLSEGTAGVQFSRPNSPAVGAVPIAGGVVLTAAVDTGDTSITVNTASPGGEPILPGETVKLVEGGVVEVLRIARTYTIGSTTIPLESEVANNFTTAAFASIMVTSSHAIGSVVYSNGRDGFAAWNAIDSFWERCEVYDWEDSAFDLPSGGSRNFDIRSCTAVGMGRWLVSVDEVAETEEQFGRCTDCKSVGNRLRFLPGGDVFVGGGAVDGIYLGVSERFQSINDTFDLTLAGISGVRLGGNTTLFPVAAKIINPTVIGPATPRADTFGVRSTLGAADTELFVSAGDISGIETAVDGDMIRRMTIDGTRARNFTAYGYNILADSGNAQSATVTNVDADGGVAAIRAGGSPAAGAVLKTRSEARGYSFASITYDAGWTHVSLGDTPAIPSTTLVASANASGNLTLSTTPTDVPGATLTFTAPVPGKVLVTGDFDFNSVNGSNVCAGSLLVDGAAQTPLCLAFGAMSRVMQSRTWVVAIAAGSHTVKLRAYTIGGPTAESTGADHTGISYLFVPTT